MDRTAATVVIQDQLGFSSAHASRIVIALKNAQTRREQDPFLPWFLKTDSAIQPVTVADQRTVALPTGFLREVEDDALYYVNADESSKLIPMEKQDHLDYLYNTYGVTEGTPAEYFVGKTNFHIFPLPDAVYTLQLNQYYKAATSLASDVENDWLLYAEDTIIGDAGYVIAKALRDRKAQDFFKVMQREGTARMILGTTAREEENVEHQMGGDD